MKCKYEPCNNEAQGKSLYCGKSCRAQHSRRNKSSATSEAQPGQVTGSIVEDGPVEVKRHDELVTDGHGEIVGIKQDTTHEVAPGSTKSGKPIAECPVRSRTTGCRVAIPGDEDYDGIGSQDLAEQRAWKVSV